ncbi:NADH-quinone oxidoreductase subunit N [Emticicia sp. TH156]|uniref:NADH-quinone oxidoreductase subunit N n=1 Tax=Emticicia sp. TH156 TaxID=2067454 RepID=UPI000C769A63|nr:NADH-quinone oxidoreductase subunit N [Emticicia sp. TH156]PLK45058.1 NADH-quinone oxidoreductase subunit N [Emticicia sp. TH156]
MPEKISHILSSSRLILPELIFAGVFLVVVGIVAFSKQYRPLLYNILTLVVLVIIGFIFFASYHFLENNFNSGVSLFHGLIFLDSLSIFFKVTITLAAAAVILHLWIVGYQVVGEFYVLFLALILGLFIMSMTSHLLTLYVAIETVSICSYILVVINKTKPNAEAGIKYLLTGATSSAVMLYGVSILYGMTGTLNFGSHEFMTFLGQNPPWVANLAVFMTIGGLLFKLSAVPFHSWTPDVYEASPTPIVAFLSIAPKLGVVIVLIRFLNGLSIDFRMTLAIIITGSLLIGNLSALWQNNTKRMLGYSTIAHAGFMLVGLLALNQFGVQSATFYVATYLFITLAAFLLVDLLALKTESYELESLKGLGQENVFLGLAAVIIMIALVGFPPTVGFTGKLLIFTALWNAYNDTGNNVVLVVLIISLLNTAISVFYYLRIPYFMIFKDPKGGAKRIALDLEKRVLLFIYIFLLVYLFLNPGPIMKIIESL